MWRRPLGLLLLLLLLLAGELGVGARRGRRRRELAPALHQRGIRDAGGRYCQEQDLCCRGRADDCALPYLGVTCYCDLFCNRTVSDCCPDFWVNRHLYTHFYSSIIHNSQKVKLLKFPSR